MELAQSPLEHETGDSPVMTLWKVSLLAGVLAGLVAGCSPEVVTDAPVSQEEEAELAEQREMIEKQAAGAR